MYPLLRCNCSRSIRSAFYYAWLEGNCRVLQGLQILPEEVGLVAASDHPDVAALNERGGGVGARGKRGMLYQACPLLALHAKKYVD